MAEVCGHIASVPLDRSKPLWEMWVIEASPTRTRTQGGLFAVMIKVHHAAADGVTGANLLSQLCSLEADCLRRTRWKVLAAEAGSRSPRGVW